MLQQLLLTTVLLPLAMGILIALAAQAAGARAPIVIALLIPLAACVAAVSIEGWPAFPPVAAKQKLPVILLVGSVALALAAAMLQDRLTKRIAAPLLVLALALPIWWLGRNVLAANMTKAVVVAIVAVITVLILTVIASRASDRKAAAPAAVPAALLWVAIASALGAVFGGYIGMAQMGGALAALTGGWLLVGYIRYLRGDDRAFVTAGIVDIAFGWTIILGLIMTVLLAPAAAPAALVIAVLPLSVALLLTIRQVEFSTLPRLIRPLAVGAVTAVPALVAILIAATLAQG